MNGHEKRGSISLRPFILEIPEHLLRETGAQIRDLLQLSGKNMSNEMYRAKMQSLYLSSQCPFMKNLSPLTIGFISEKGFEHICMTLIGSSSAVGLFSQLIVTVFGLAITTKLIGVT